MARLSPDTWAELRVCYETSDISNAKLGEMYGVSGVMVGRKAKQGNWTRPKLPASLGGTSIIQARQGSEAGLRSEEALKKFLSIYALSGSVYMACKASGASQKTVERWRKEDPKLDDEMEIARAAKLAEYIRKIADSKDWKAALKLLQIAPETKEQFADRQKDESPKIVLNIVRDKVMIDPDPSAPVPTIPDETPRLDGDDVATIESAEDTRPTETCWQGDNISERKAQSELQAIEQRILALNNK